MQCGSCSLKSNFHVVEIELEDGEMPLHIFIGTESAQLLNSNRICIFAYSVLADVIGIFKLLLLKLLAAVVWPWPTRWTVWLHCVSLTERCL